MTVDHDDGDRRAVRLVGALLVTIGLALAWVAVVVYLTPDLSAAVAVLVIAHLSCGAVLLLPLGGPGSARVARWAAAILLTADLVIAVVVLDGGLGGLDAAHLVARLVIVALANIAILVVLVEVSLRWKLLSW